jgi:hypothetical protein
LRQPTTARAERRTFSNQLICLLEDALGTASESSPGVVTGASE